MWIIIVTGCFYLIGVYSMTYCKVLEEEKKKYKKGVVYWVLPQSILTHNDCLFWGYISRQMGREKNARQIITK